MLTCSVLSVRLSTSSYFLRNHFYLHCFFCVGILGPSQQKGRGALEVESFIHADKLTINGFFRSPRWSKHTPQVHVGALRAHARVMYTLRWLWFGVHVLACMASTSLCPCELHAVDNLIEVLRVILRRCLCKQRVGLARRLETQRRSISLERKLLVVQVFLL